MGFPGVNQRAPAEPRQVRKQKPDEQPGAVTAAQAPMLTELVERKRAQAAEQPDTGHAERQREQWNQQRRWQKRRQRADHRGAHRKHPGDQQGASPAKGTASAENSTVANGRSGSSNSPSAARSATLPSNSPSPATGTAKPNGRLPLMISNASESPDSRGEQQTGRALLAARGPAEACSGSDSVAELMRRSGANLAKTGAPASGSNFTRGLPGSPRCSPPYLERLPPSVKVASSSAITSRWRRPLAARS